MGFLGLTIGKKATAKKREFKLAKLTTRLNAKTDRVIVRQEQKSIRTGSREATKAVAYESGVTPTDVTASITGLIGTGIKGVASFFGGNSTSEQLQDSGGITPGTPPVLADNTMAGLELSKGISPIMIAGGILLLIMLMKKR